MPTWFDPRLTPGERRMLQHELNWDGTSLLDSIEAALRHNIASGGLTLAKGRLLLFPTGVAPAEVVRRVSVGRTS